MKLTLGFSPCPNDTFIFDAMVNGDLDTEGLKFDVVLEDVQTLNQWAIEGKLDISKISYGVLNKVLPTYKVLNSGSALGMGVGPLLISKNALTKEDEISKMTVAIPGENTTAHFLFKMAYPNSKNKVFLRYDEIENFVLDGKGLGVIIHENRFTYAEKGLNKIKDLGDYWETSTGNPIPLGGIVVKRNLDNQLQEKIEKLITKSIEKSYERLPSLSAYIQEHAQEMTPSVMKQHIDLYVNQYSLDLGKNGKSAIVQLLSIIENKPATTYIDKKIFL
jgi:1,4-dihydroxy-6-naphthoate synthase